MIPFKRGFVEKCAEFGFDKEAAKELFKKLKKNMAAHEAGESPAKEEKEEACAKTAAADPGILDALQAFASAHKSQLMGAGVGAGLGGLAGAGIAGEGNRGKGALGGALAGGAGGYFAGPEISAWMNRQNQQSMSEAPGLQSKEDPNSLMPYLKDVKDQGPLAKGGPTSDMLIKQLAEKQKEMDALKAATDLSKQQSDAAAAISKQKLNMADRSTEAYHNTASNAEIKKPQGFFGALTDQADKAITDYRKTVGDPGSTMK